MSLYLSTLMMLAVIFPLGPSPAAAEKIVIAHRGASGYLPEHSLPAKAVAHAMGADYIEQDLVMTRDDRLVVLHDLYLDHVTDVARVFPGRHRRDGRFYVVDFTLAEIQRLALTERVANRGGRRVPRFPGRFPPGKSSFRISTFEEEIELIQGLNHSTGREVGLYPELKAPAFHRREGRDIGHAVLEVLKAYGYTDRGDRIYLQCFDPEELRRLRRHLLPKMDMDLPLVQLIGKSEWDTLGGALPDVAAYADGIGPAMEMVVREASTRDHLLFTGLVAEAHAAGLVVHAYTLRAEKTFLPSYAEDFEDLLDIFLFKAGVDGIFTDYPDRAVVFLR